LKTGDGTVHLDDRREGALLPQAAQAYEFIETSLDDLILTGLQATGGERHGARHVPRQFVSATLWKAARMIRTRGDPMLKRREMCASHPALPSGRG